MADDLATLSLRLTNEQAIADAKATGAAMEDMGNKGEAAAAKISASSNPVTEAIKKQAVTVEQSRVAWAASGGDMHKFAQELERMASVGTPVPPALNRITDSTRRMTLMQMEAIAMNEKLSASTSTAAASTIASTRGMGVWAALQAESAGHVGSHSIAIGRLERNLASVTEKFLGLNPTIGLVSSSLLKFGVGSTETIAILAGIAAIAAAWEYFTGAARKAREENEKLRTSLEESNIRAKLGPEPDLVLQTNAQRDEVMRLRERRRQLTAFGARPDDDRIVALNLEIAHGQAALEEGEKRLFKARMDATKPLDTVVTRAKDYTAEMMKQQELLVRYNALMHSTFGGSAPNEMTSPQRAAWLANQHGRTMTDTESNAITGPMAQSILDDIKNTTAAAVDMAVRSYKDGTGKVLTEATRDVAERNKKMLNEMQRDLANFFTSIFTQGIKSFSDLFSSIKDMFLRLIAEMTAARIMEKMAGSFAGFALTGGKGFLGSNSWSAGGKMLGATGLGLGIGSAVGQMAGDATGGAIGGGLGGAAAGFMIAGPVGAAIGGLSGLVSGLLGGASAAREAAAAMRQLQKDYVAAVASFQHDNLAKALADNEAQAQQLRKMAEDLYHTVSYIITHGIGDYQKALADIAAQEARNAAAIRRQAQQTPEDLQVRMLTALGQDKAAAALKLQHDQARERQALIDSFGSEIDKTEQATLSLLYQVQAQEKLKAATDAASASALNMVSGYKLQATIFAAMNPRTAGGGLAGGVPSQGDLTVNVTLDGQVIGKAVLTNFKAKAQKKFGDSSRWPEIQS